MLSKKGNTPWLTGSTWKRISTKSEVYESESADVLSKEGSDLDQHDKSVSCKDEKTIIKSFIARKWHQKHPNFKPTDDYHYLDRAD